MVLMQLFYFFFSFARDSSSYDSIVLFTFGHSRVDGLRRHTGGRRWLVNYSRIRCYLLHLCCSSGLLSHTSLGSRKTATAKGDLFKPFHFQLTISVCLFIGNNVPRFSAIPVYCHL